jgi:hypothetical protein
MTRKHAGILAGIIVGAGLLYALSYDPSRFGIYHDDSLYATTAKALASGNGYRIISLPYEPAATKYPPFYPFLLSLIWRLNPHFPDNVNAMVALSGLAALLFAGFTWRYLVGCGYASNRLALLVVAMTAANWRTSILATGLYSEMPYAALSVIALMLAERAERDEEHWLRGVGLGLAMGACFLTRSSGVTILIAVAVYFVAKKKFSRVALAIGIGVLVLAGWFGWCNFNRTTFTGVNAAFYTDYLAYFKQIVLDLQLHDHTSLAVTLLGVLWKNLLTVVLVSPPVLCLGIDYAWMPYMGFAVMFNIAGFVRDVSKGWRLLHVYVFCYLALHVVWLPFFSYDRYLMPILPFLLLWMVRELVTMGATAKKTFATASPRIQKGGAAAIALALGTMMAVAAYTYGSSLYMSLAMATLDKEVKPTSNDEAAIHWIMTNTSPSDVLVCSRDPMYFLYTGRKAVRSLPMTGGLPLTGKEGLLLDIVAESEGRYLVLTAGDLENAWLKEVTQRHPEEFIPVFNSSNGAATIYRIDSAAARR